MGELSERARRAVQLLLLAIGLTGVLTALSAGTAFAVAPGCTSTRPTAIGGALYGYPDDYSLDALVGMDLANSSNQKVDIDGNVITVASYSYVDRVNPTLPASGQPSGGDRTWGQNGTTGYLCVSAAVVTGFFEVYPKDPDGTTDKVRYGEAADQWDPISPGAVNTYDLRLPLRHDLGGNTGDINGYITYGGHRVDPSAIVMRVWPNDQGTACGVQGFSTSADSVGYSGSLDATYYLIRALAGGQCWADSQSYRVYAYCYTVCGASRRTIEHTPVYVANGARPRVDFAF